MPASLAEIVIAEGLVGEEVVQAAAEASDALNVPLAVALVQREDLDEVALMAALKKHLRIKTLDPGKVEFDSDALRELSLEEARRLYVVPLSVGVYGPGPRVLHVAMADPTDTMVLKELEHLTNCSVEPVLATVGALGEMIETAYKHFVTEVMKRAPTRGGFAGGAAVKPSTQPHHRLTDEASASQRLEALVQLCVDKGLFERREYDEQLLSLVKAKKST